MAEHVRREVHIVMNPDLWPDLSPVWCDAGQMNCWEQPLSQAEDAPLTPCRWCDAARA